MTREIEKWWDSVSNNYQEGSKIRSDSVHYGPFAPNEEKLNLLGNVRGKKILEIGCGGGQCSIAFARRGAECTGLDISKEQLKFAGGLARRNKVSVNFMRHDIQTLKGFSSNVYDIVFSAYALLYVPNLIKCFGEVERVLKKRGIFVFSLDHPFYSVISPKTFKIESNYNKSGKHVEIYEWDGPNGPKHKFVMYRHKISEIYESLMKAGFSVERIIETSDSKTEKAWREGEWKEIYPMRLVNMLCPTIIFKARKK